MTRFFRRPTCWVVTFSAFVLSFAASSPARAGTILSDNLTATTGGTETAVADSWLTAGFGTDGASYTLTSITLLLQRDSISGKVELDVYNDGGLQPDAFVGALSLAGAVSTSLTETTFTTAGLALAANSNYWVVLKAVTGQFAWAWANDASGQGVGFQHTWGSSDDAGSSWFTFDSYPLQMSVTAAAVPEPSSLIPFALGAGVVLIHYTRRSSASTSSRIV
ncbi:MAG: choice-of-anchor R domain-containing protein [Paludisphaera borealis]|uniref:choice-of-anchor R domain-containing protein n=1 Tax=Paludisphaera borealis TaxID=1387353 RepID=UPI00283FE137|nr:choice-of-anchor R domain-containing protein [Paludisphaera borealis]MDR3618024.1 choice-of-anchor R domain-containing protein [Paludisphaera borealis]